MRRSGRIKAMFHCLACRRISGCDIGRSKRYTYNNLDEGKSGSRFSASLIQCSHPTIFNLVSNTYWTQETLDSRSFTLLTTSLRHLNEYSADWTGGSEFFGPFHFLSRTTPVSGTINTKVPIYIADNCTKSLVSVYQGLRLITVTS